MHILFAIVPLLILILLIAAVSFASEVDMNIIEQIESGGNPLAHNRGENARGLFQIRPPLLREYNEMTHHQYSESDLFNPIVNHAIAKWYLYVRIPQMLKHFKKPVTVRNVIICYNAGISYVAHGKRIPPITERYLQKYRKLKGAL